MSYNPKASLHSGRVNTRDYTPVSAVSAGDIVIINGVCYVAPADIAAGALGSLVVSGGVWKVNKKSGAVTDGDLVYYKATEDPVVGTAGTGAATTSSSGSTAFGYAVADAASGDQFVYVWKMPAATVTATITSNVASAISDPGDGGAIPVTDCGYVALVTGSAHTRTLAAPTFIGQELLLYVKTDGGTVVITVASAINQTGNNTITMADVRDCIRLQAIESGSNKVWDVVVNNGASLSTV